MKQLKVEITLSKNKKHTIHLGNCQWLEHKSKRFIQRYKGQYSKVLTDNIRILNFLSKDVYSIYRNYSFELDDWTDRKVLKRLHTFDDQFNKIFRNYSTGNQNAFSFSAVEICFQQILDSLHYLKKFSDKNKNYSLKSQIKGHLKLLSQLEHQFESDKRSLTLTNDYLDSRFKIVTSKSKAS